MEEDIHTTINLTQQDNQIQKDSQKEVQITDVNASTFHFIYSHPYLYIPYLFVLISGFLISYLKSTSEVFFVTIFFSLFFPLIVSSLISRKIRDRMMEQFSRSLGYTYTPIDNVANFEGSIFNVGHSQMITDVISGVDKNHSVKIFLYNYTIGYGKSSQVYYFTVMENILSNNVPHILLYNQQSFFSGSNFSFSGEESISLEGDFNKYFSVLVKKGFETEAYEIFTPDFMEELIETSKTFNFEFYKNKFYIYTSHFINSRSELDSMFSLSNKLYLKLEPIIQSMKGDIEAMEELTKIHN